MTLAKIDEYFNVVGDWIGKVIGMIIIAGVSLIALAVSIGLFLFVVYLSVQFVKWCWNN